WFLRKTRRPYVGRVPRCVPMPPRRGPAAITRESVGAAEPALLRVFREGKDGVDVDRDVPGGRQRRLQVRRHLVVLVEPGIRARAVAGRFLLEQLLRQPRGGVA